MKNLTYFLFFLLGIGFTSIAQETITNPKENTSPINSEVEYYYIHPCPPIRQAKNPPSQNRYVDYDAKNRSHRLREYKFDIAFYNAHSGNNVELYLLIDDSEIKDAHFTNVMSPSNFIDVERYYQYGESEFYPLQIGLLNTRDL